jgi:hypothetical protein
MSLLDPRLFRIAFWLSLALVFGLAMLTQPPELAATLGPELDQSVSAALTVNDKAQHLLAFAALAIFAFRGWPGIAALKVLLGLSAYGALIELAQSTPLIGGDVEFADWFADTAAVAAVALVVSVARWTRQAR